MDYVKMLGDAGYFFQNALAILIVTGVSLLRFEWRCGLCGKITSGNILKFLLMWCDHGGSTS